MQIAKNEVQIAFSIIIIIIIIIIYFAIFFLDLSNECLLDTR